MAKEMTERKLRSKLLSYYLVRAELGDSEAQKKAEEIGRQIEEPMQKLSGKCTKVEVYYPDGTVGHFPSIKETAHTLGLSRDRITHYEKHNKRDPKGRKYKYLKGD
jgi:hypothetical protein